MPTPTPPVAPPGDPSNAQQHTLVALEEEFGDTVTQGVMNDHLRKADLLEDGKPIVGSKQLTADQENILRERFGGGDPASEQPHSRPAAPRTRSAARKARSTRQPNKTASPPTGTSPKNDTTPGGPMPASPIAPPDPVQPELPLPAPAVTPQSSLEEKAIASVKVGIENMGITERDSLVKVVVHALGSVYVPPPGETIAQINQRISKAATDAVDLHPRFTDTPSAPPAASASVPDSALLALAKKHTEAGISSGKKGGDLQVYVGAKLEDTPEWKNASEDERKSALADSAPKKASVKDTWNKIRDWADNPSIKLLGLFLVGGVALFGLGAFYVGIVLPWWGQRSLLFLFVPALALVAWAFITRRKNAESSIRLVSILFAGLLVAAGGIFVSSELAAMAAQTQSVHGTPVAVTGNLLEACTKVIPKGQFNLSKDLKACALRLSSASKDTSLSVPEKQAYRTLATLSGWVDCNQQPLKINTAPGRTVFASCANARTKQFLGPDVFAAIEKIDRISD